VCPAHDAEIEDILAMFDFLDNRDQLKTVQFVAIQLDKLPKFGPNEINICSIADKQVDLEADIQSLQVAVDGLKTNPTASTDIAPVSELVHQHTQIQVQITMLNDVCSQILQKIDSQHCGQAGPSVPPFDQSRGQGQPANTSTTANQHPSERHRNVMVFGVDEQKQATEWSKVVSKAFRVAAGRNVEFDDAFRVGKFNPDKTRPILVKLRAPWDKRLVVNGAWKLHSVPEYRRIFIRNDESLEDRRRHTLQRLKYRAERDGKTVEVADGVLLIDDVPVFDVKTGLVQVTTTANGSKH
jgi:hypothetical protein